MIRIGLISAILAVIFSPISSATDIYKWVDKNGVTHYSQQPPADKPVNTLDSSAIEPGKIGTVAPIKRNDEPVKTQQELDADAINAKDAAQAEKLCESARFNLDVLLTHTRLQRSDDKTGEPVKMTEEDRQKAIADQQERIRLFCVKK
ncbi:DUF4124 domain-containing protein [Shewanella yunxiaonensis]|uniref:DUF4124 domain-containing protein n=1 Tax=Shewanella yunxiaonensis TaxID=2829809 RepID=A0ABX7YRX8_9GAMM|nr:DUF4124 domain-containing protein [Shewanella yunxiaonensis]QUN05135.1 DUF4124 domain-containing protein [Shewanella yunxiaonensis]